MKFIIAIEPNTDTTAFGVAVPDLPGCFSAGDTLDEALENAHEAIDLWCETVIEDGGEIPIKKSLTEHQINPDYAGWIWSVVDVPIERYFGQVENLNITMPRLLLAKVNEYVRQHETTLSDFLTNAAQVAMQ